MGNVSCSCCRSKGVVKVVLLNGDIAEFKGVVTASMVMKQYPQHLVLHCSMVTNRGMAQRRKVIVVKPEQTLKVNHNYIIIPIQSVESSRSFLDSWAFFSLNSSHTKVSSVRYSKKHNRRWCMITRLWAKVFKSKRQPLHSNDEATKPLLDPYRVAYTPPRSKVSRSCSEGPKDWRPSLECIPESPIIANPPSRSSSYCSYYDRF